MTPNKLLISLPISRAQTKKNGNNSTKLKKEIRQILYLLNQHSKISKKFTTISLSYYNHGIKFDCNRKFQNLLF